MIKFEVHDHIGKIILNRPAALNAMTYDMFLTLREHLFRWEKDSNITAVLIRSVVEKAFCAGGDIRAIYENRELPAERLCDYFRLEYEVNRMIAHYDKPYIALMHGITMGGGVGISLHGSHTVAADNIRWAMPETVIGFFPDIGATYYLSRLPHEVGTYLALTGMHLNAENLQALGLVNAVVPFHQFDALEKKLLSEKGHDVGEVIAIFSIKSKKEVTLPLEDIADCFSFPTVELILDALENKNNAWSRETITLLSQRSPTSLKVALRQMDLAKQKSIDEVLAMDLQIAHRMLENHDFYEGVRAAIIDKDKNPQWQPNQLALVTDKMVEKYC